MKFRFLLAFSAVAVSVLVLAPRGHAQVATGTPALGSFSGAPDVVNNASLNVHIAVPIAQKAGRGTNFNYQLTYDSSVWYPVPSGSAQAWQPVTTASLSSMGWQGGIGAGNAFIAYSLEYTQWSCGPYGDTVQQWDFNQFYYFDTLGASHTFSGVSGVYYNNTSTGNPPYCPTNGPTPAAPWIATADDGSGYTINISPDPLGTTTAYIVDPKGTVINPPVISNPPSEWGSINLTDRNGNRITSSSGVYTDTLGQTALTVSGTAPNPTTFSYTAPSGATAKYTMKYTSKTVRTSFGCSGITDYGPKSMYLVTEIDLPDQGVNSYDKYTFTYESTPGYSGDVTGRIASVTLPTGGTINYTYTGTYNGIVCADGSAAGLTRQTPDGTWTYARSGFSGAASTTTITDPQNNESVLQFQGIYVTERQVYQGSTSGTLLKTVYTCYNGSASPCNSTGISQPITQRSSVVQWPGTNGQEAKVVTSYNSYGLATETDEYPYGAGAPGSLVRKTLTSYASLGNGIVDMPGSVTIEDGSSNVKAQTNYTYDQGSVVTTTGTPQHNGVSGSRGNATTVQYLVTGSTYLTETLTYYDTGNVDVTTDVNSATTTYNYSNPTATCGNAFPSSVTEAISTLSRSMTWNCTGGVQVTATDENSQTVSTSYTNAYFWRPDSSTDQLSNTTNFTYTDATGSTGASVKSSLLFNSSNSATNNLVTLDGLGRVLVSQTEETPTGSTWDSVESDYDSLGRPDRATLPYQAASGVTNSSAPSTQTAYDPLGRKTQVTDSSGKNLQFTYSQNDTYRTLGPAPTGENAKKKQYEYDALGRLTSVCEITAGTSAWPGGNCAQTSAQTGYWTQYTYDLLNDLIGVTQNAQASSNHQTRTYNYDDLGRMTSETNPESGTIATTYTYDTDSTCGTSKGDLVKKTDQVGNTICYAYDALHRLTSATYPSGSYASVTPSRYLVYDSATVNSVVMAHPKARLAEAYTCFSPCTSKTTDLGFSYTVRGQVSDVYESTPHSSTYYHVTATYWANGAPDVLSNLSGLPTVTYGVDGEGRIYSASASSGQNPLSSTTYNAASEPEIVTFGSSDTDTFGYDPNSDRMNSYTFSVNAQSVTGTLTWNSIGTLEKLVITDAFNSTNAQTCNYTHDDLSRIATDNCGSNWSQTFSYDAFGNISKSGTQSFLPTYSASTNHMTSIGSNTPTYDANGNVMNDFLNTYAWDSNGRPVTVDTVGVTYDALGRMVEQNKSGTYSEIVYSPLGSKLAIMQGTTLQKAFVLLTGGTEAVYTPSGTPLYYRHSDWLGSSRLASTQTHTVYYDGAYGPFGEQYANSGTTDLSFTGMNQDTASNVYDFPAREYGIQGRWPSPDPSGLAAVHIKDPQSLNRYAYVRNNPLRMIDPTGLDCEDSSFRRRSHRGAARLRMRPIAADDDSDDGDCGDDSGDDGGGGGGGGGDCNDDSSCGDDSNDDDDECDAACQQQELDDAESEALAALSNPECAQAVDGGSPAAANTLQNPVSIDSNTLGTIGIADLSALTPKGTVLGSLTIFSGSSSDFGPQSNIEVNSGTPGFFTIYVPGWTYGISQGIFLLHELGHAATNTGTLTSSVQTDSLGSAGVSISVQNNETVGNACFPQGDGPNQGQLDPAAPVAAARRRKHF